MKRLHISTA